VELPQDDLGGATASALGKGEVRRTRRFRYESVSDGSHNGAGGEFKRERLEAL